MPENVSRECREDVRIVCRIVCNFSLTVETAASHDARSAFEMGKERSTIRHVVSLERNRTNLNTCIIISTAASDSLLEVQSMRANGNESLSVKFKLQMQHSRFGKLCRRLSCVESCFLSDMHLPKGKKTMNRIQHSKNCSAGFR